MPTDIFITTKLLDRFIAKVRFEDDHWIWTGGTTGKHRSAHGQFYFNGKKELAHRVSYMLFNGPLAGDQMVLHQCNIGLCVNPACLYAGDHQQNMKDRAAAGRTARGERQGRSKLNDDLVRAIRAAEGTPTSIGHQFGLSRGHVANIRAGRVWAHVQAA